MPNINVQLLPLITDIAVRLEGNLFVLKKTVKVIESRHCRNVLFRGGNAVEASIASLLCIGVVNPQSSGLGGGFIMTIFNATTQRCLIVDARETAPSGATEDMFVDTPLTSNNGSVFGYRSIAIPGELHGYYTAFSKHGSGRITWESLFQPAIDLARNGFPVSSNLAMVLQKLEHKIREDEDMRYI